MLALAIFDCILIGMLRIIAPSTWQPLKHSLCDAFNKNKSHQVINILRNSYDDMDVIFIQEAAASFVDHAKVSLETSIQAMHFNEKIRNLDASCDITRCTSSRLVCWRVPYQNAPHAHFRVHTECCTSISLIHANTHIFCFLLSSCACLHLCPAIMTRITWFASCLARSNTTLHAPISHHHDSTDMSCALTPSCTQKCARVLSVARSDQASSAVCTGC